MHNYRTMVIDVLLALAVTVIAAIALLALIIDVPRYVFAAAVAGLTLVAAGGVAARFITRPDQLRAKQSHVMLEIANESLAHLRGGLVGESAEAVCRLILARTEVAAVAMTDTEKVLGFAGIGEDHHARGGPIMTKATREALESGEHRVLESREDIGCPKPGCLLRAAIVVPLEVRGTPVGTLKFYYTTPRLLNETQIAMAEGLARLLSTQLELGELDRQTELACRMELKALQAQIHPHFLFNTINTIAMLIRTDPLEARRLLREFAAFYRRTLEAPDAPVPLQTEFEYVRSYLTFERARFGELIEYSERIDPATLDVSVPAFIVQPLVENAIQHGMRPTRKLRVELAANRLDGIIRVTVTDDGVGMPADDVARALEPGFGKGMGIALKNVDDRLRGHFGPGSGLKIESRQGSGTSVTLTLVVGNAAENRM